MSPGQKTPSDVIAPAAPPAQVDERLRKTSIVTEAMRRPELGAIAGLIVVLIFFLFTASPTMFTLSGVMTILAPASQLGILRSPQPS